MVFLILPINLEASCLVNQLNYPQASLSQITKYFYSQHLLQISFQIIKFFFNLLHFDISLFSFKLYLFISLFIDFFRAIAHVFV